MRLLWRRPHLFRSSGSKAPRTSTQPRSTEGSESERETEREREEGGKEGETTDGPRPVSEFEAGPSDATPGLAILLRPHRSWQRGDRRAKKPRAPTKASMGPRASVPLQVSAARRGHSRASLAHFSHAGQSERKEGDGARGLSQGGPGSSCSSCGRLPVHFVQEWGGVAGHGHGRALDHGAGRRARGQPLLLLPAFGLLLLQPLLGHLAPVDGRVGGGPAGGTGQTMRTGGVAPFSCGCVLRVGHPIGRRVRRPP